MTTNADKLVQMARECRAVFTEQLPISSIHPSRRTVTFEIDELAAFASAHVASLCADVEPVGEVVLNYSSQLERCHPDGDMNEVQWLEGSPTPSAGTMLYPATAIASLTAQRDAALARVAELEKDAARWRFSMWYQQEHLKNPSLRCEAIDELYRSRVELSADNYTAAIDKAITSTPDYDAALTKGQP